VCSGREASIHILRLIGWILPTVSLPDHILRDHDVARLRTAEYGSAVTISLKAAPGRDAHRVVGACPSPARAQRLSAFGLIAHKT
jgi:hypothetical protein